MKILLANPRGFCAGVDRAIAIVERALEQFGAPIYVRHEVVHNRTVVDGLKAKGVIFTDVIEDIPPGSVVIFSAHGVSQAVRTQAAARNLQVFDATCPLVTKVHFEVARCARQGLDCVLIGHAGHPEVEGTLGQYQPQSQCSQTDSISSTSSRGEAGASAQAVGHIYLVESIADVDQLALTQPQRCAYVTQTTLSVDDTQAIIQALKIKYPDIQGPRREDICYATQNRQDAVKALAAQCDVVLVVGSSNSSNSNRLREIAERLGCGAFLLDDPAHIPYEQLRSDAIVGVTAGASAPEPVVQAVVAALQLRYDVPLSQVQSLAGQDETIVFAMPKALR